MAELTSARMVLFDLLSALLDSLSLWKETAGSDGHGIAWRRRVAALMIEAGRYTDYGALVERAASECGLDPTRPVRLFERWSTLRPWPDVELCLASLAVPFGIVTNCSSRLAIVAAACLPCRPSLIVSAEAAGYYKPSEATYAFALDEAGLDASSVIYVAGSPYDFEGASHAGLPALLIDRNSTIASSAADRLRALDELAVRCPSAFGVRTGGPTQ